jgi:hypothetical protein
MTRKRWSAKIRMEILRDYNQTCYLCKQPISRDAGWDLHHTIPLAIGGTDTVDNLAPVHRKCHRASEDHARIPKARRQEQKSWGVKSQKGRGFPKVDPQRSRLSRHEEILERAKAKGKAPLARRPLYVRMP